MMAMATNWSRESTVYVKGIDANLSKAQAQGLFLEICKFKKFMLSSSKFDKYMTYALIEYEDPQTAENAISLISGKKVNNFTLEASKYKPKTSKTIENKSEVYNNIKDKIQEIYEFGLKRIAASLPVQEKTKENFKVVVEETINMDMPVSQVMEILSKKLAMDCPEILNKGRRNLRKLGIEQLYSLLYEDSAWVAFLGYLKNND
ncbi:hypothetical protein SteCoe_1336 [Stentor coeruleus]|uniref:RRM domain-containing protein n=1 Tax=Stentor coeruleus TaxID=5963 RepID=A0A1R2D249_9CILI|nr:hypothetical protein SteCoe_1336 [Stentor coeruleus]